MNEEKIYVGSGKLKVFNNGGSIIDIALTLDGIGAYFEKYGFTTKNGKKMIRLVLSERREADKFGNTHTLTINTWKPENKSSYQSGGNTPNQGNQPPQSNSQPTGGNYEQGGFEDSEILF